MLSGLLFIVGSLKVTSGLDAESVLESLQAPNSPQVKDDLVAFYVQEMQFLFKYVCV